MSFLETRSTMRMYRAAGSGDASTAFALSDNAMVSPAVYAALTQPVVNMAGYRGLPQLIFTGRGAENSTYSVKLWLLDQYGGPSPHAENVGSEFILRHYATYDVTLGAKIGTGGNLLATTDRIADTVVLNGSLTAWATELNTRYGITHSIFSPGSDGIASVCIMDMFDVYGWLLEYDMTGATSGNALFKLAT